MPCQRSLLPLGPSAFKSTISAGTKGRRGTGKVGVALCCRHSWSRTSYGLIVTTYSAKYVHVHTCMASFKFKIMRVHVKMLMAS